VLAKLTAGSPGGLALLIPGFEQSDGFMSSIAGTMFATVLLGAVFALWTAAFDPDVATPIASAVAATPEYATAPVAQVASAVGQPAFVHPAAHAQPAELQQAQQHPADPSVGSAQYAPVAAPPALQVVELVVSAQPNTPAGTWWYVGAGAQVGVEVQGSVGQPPAPIASDANGGWLQMQPGPHAAAGSCVAPAAGWYLFGAWLTDPNPQQVRLRLTLPADAQPAPSAA